MHPDRGPAPPASSAATWDWRVDSDRVAFSAAWHALLGDTKADTTESLHAWLGRIHPDDPTGRDPTGLPGGWPRSGSGGSRAPWPWV